MVKLEELKLTNFGLIPQLLKQEILYIQAIV